MRAADARVAMSYLAASNGTVTLALALTLALGAWQPSCVMERLFAPGSGAHLADMGLVKLTGYDRQFLLPLHE